MKQYAAFELPLSYDNCSCGTECYSWVNAHYCSDNCIEVDAMVSQGTHQSKSIAVLPRLQNTKLQSTHTLSQPTRAIYRIGSTGWYLDAADQPHSVDTRHTEGPSARLHLPVQAITGSSSSQLSDEWYKVKKNIDRFLRSAQQQQQQQHHHFTSLSSKASMSSEIIFPAINDDEDQLLTQMAELRGLSPPRQDSFDDSEGSMYSVESIEAGYEEPIGWQGGNPLRSSNLLGLYQSRSSKSDSNGSIAVKVVEPPVKIVPPPLITSRISEEARRTQRSDVEKKSQQRPPPFTAYSSQREHIKFASACASELLVAPTTSPSLSLRRLIKRPLLNRKTKNKLTLPNGISSLDEPWTYQRRSEEGDKRSMSTASQSTTSSRWTQFSSPKRKPVKLIISRPRAYTSHHAKDGHPFLESRT